MTEAPIRNLVIEQGEDWTESFQILDSDGVVQSLAGMAIEGEARLTQDQTSALGFTFTFALDTGINTVTITVSAATTNAMTVGYSKHDATSRFWYDYKMTDSLGVKHRIQQGIATISRAITS